MKPIEDMRTEEDFESPDFDREEEDRARRDEYEADDAADEYFR
jgi:hypothetical protein